MLTLYLALLLVPTAAIVIWGRALSLFNIHSWNAFRLTGLIGTPVHELSHVIACVVFGMRVQKVSLFSPDPVSGQLGVVNFMYRPGSVFHLVGRLVQAIAPLITGSIVMLYFFDIRQLNHPEPHLTAILSWLASVAQDTFVQSCAMFASDPIGAFKTVLIICVAMHAIPSTADVVVGAKALIMCAIATGAIIAIWQSVAAIVTFNVPWLNNSVAFFGQFPIVEFVVAKLQWLYAQVYNAMLWCLAGAVSVLALSFSANILLVVLPALTIRSLRAWLYAQHRKDGEHRSAETLEIRG